jgi:hypothetical protein
MRNPARARNARIAVLCVVACVVGLYATIMMSHRAVMSTDKDPDGLLVGIAQDCATLGAQDRVPIERRLQKCIELYSSGFAIWKGRSICVNASVDVWNDVTEKGESSATLCFVAVQDSPPQFRCVTRSNREWKLKTVDQISDLPTEFVLVDKGIAKTIFGPSNYPKK